MKRFPKFAEYFCSLLKEHEPNKTISEVAESLGVTQGTVSKMKTGLALPSAQLAERIASAWGEVGFVKRVEEARSEDNGKAIRHSDDMAEEVEMVMGYVDAVAKNRVWREIMARYCHEKSEENMSEKTKNEFLFILTDIYKIRKR